MNALHPLGQLIQSAEDSNGWTLREISRRVGRGGMSMSHSYVANLKTKPIRSITYDMVQALALGLAVPERTVALAAVASMGVHDIQPEEAGAAVAIARDPSLSERDRRILLAAVREMRDDETNEVPDQQPAPARSRAVADDAQSDGVTAGERGADAARGDTNVGGDASGAKAQNLQRDDAGEPPRRRRVPATPEMLEDDRDLRVLRKGLDLAARKGKIDLDEQREQQDREGESGGA